MIWVEMLERVFCEISIKHGDTRIMIDIFQEEHLTNEGVTVIDMTLWTKESVHKTSTSFTDFVLQIKWVLDMDAYCVGG
jgi:hypothetical protein